MKRLGFASALLRESPRSTAALNDSVCKGTPHVVALKGFEAGDVLPEGW